MSESEHSNMQIFKVEMKFQNLISTENFFFRVYNGSHRWYFSLPEYSSFVVYFRTQPEEALHRFTLLYIQHFIGHYGHLLFVS